MSDVPVASSFRDPSGFLFIRDGVLYRQVNRRYQEHYEHLMGSGLYETLAAAGHLVRHEEVDIAPATAEDVYKVLRPEPVPFVSYPYEWAFSALKDAALATLAVQRQALDYGMSLKDASAYNMQFLRGRPTLIDTLSFEVYREGSPWVAYRQFCQHFLAPLALMAYADVRASRLCQSFIDGIPLDLVAAFLPRRTCWNWRLLLHLHWHARLQAERGSKPLAGGHTQQRFSLEAFIGLIGNLEGTVRGLRWEPTGTTWAGYYSDHSYSSPALSHKQQLVSHYLDTISPASVWDLGSNTGLFGRIATAKGIQTIAFDIDPGCVEIAYREGIRQNDTMMLPLVLDLSNPSPAIGWAHRERMSLMERGPADTVLALALIHHLAIANNVPLAAIAAFFSAICRHALIIEFVPKGDPQVQRLLATREDVFPAYSVDAFEREFGAFFSIRNRDALAESQRVLYLMERR